MKLCDMKPHQVKLYLRVYSRLSEDDGTITMAGYIDSEFACEITWDNGSSSEGLLSEFTEVEVLSYTCQNFIQLNIVH